MERTHRQLGTRFTDGLGGNDADRFSDVDLTGSSHVHAVALGADTGPGLAGKDGADLGFGHAALDDFFGQMGIDVFILGNQDFAGLGMQDVLGREPAGETFLQSFDDFVAVLDIMNDDAFVGAAVILADDNILGYVNQTT